MQKNSLVVSDKPQSGFHSTLGAALDASKEKQNSSEACRLRLCWIERNAWARDNKGGRSWAIALTLFEERRRNHIQPASARIVYLLLSLLAT